MAGADWWMEGAEKRRDRLLRALARVVDVLGTRFQEQCWEGPERPLAMDVKARDALTRLGSTWKGDPVLLLAWTVSDAIRLNLPAPELVRIADPSELVQAIRRIHRARKGRQYLPDVDGEAMRLLRLTLRRSGATWWRDAFKFHTASRRRRELRGTCSQIGTVARAAG